ncbi:hypothetical protein AZE42_09966 [Rhizopogon vesiculosus]|uniref:Uncharacterized protein n=1 Tax=Rhizopogon vesiculosus TaxID=180088 RepID=A0A1J8QKQ7_9AGAM|nr:hypothetical protein AZE42_09966 [Rhizopogon vesiculosus]
MVIHPDRLSQQHQDHQSPLSGLLIHPNR